MARLTLLWTASAIDDEAAVADFLGTAGIHYDRWELPAEAIELAARPSLDDAGKARLLDLFREELAAAGDATGFVEADVVAVRHVPGVDDALAKFDKVHYHDDDEVRAIVGGRGVFGFIGDDGRQFLLEVEAGDYISVPAGMWHWFYCGEDRNITALRLFTDTAGWVPHYRPVTRGGAAST
jgi:1,2-dihydroxy-3-keto-5-methylthiopentene dioxygenase